MQRRDFNASRKAGFVKAVSDLALIMLAATDGSLAHDGTIPHFISDSLRMGSFGCCRITGTDWAGAMLNRGTQSCSSEGLPKYSSTICFRRERR